MYTKIQLPKILMLRVIVTVYEQLCMKPNIVSKTMFRKEVEVKDVYS